MSVIQTKREVTIEDVEKTLSSALGGHYKVSVVSKDMLKVGRPGVIPAHVRMVREDGSTIFKVRTTGLIVSRIVQACSINPRVRKALQEAYSSEAAST
ncbi:MAG TPA: hypothetical protein VEJ87_09955 [Acidimicrobiales bacterium]|nr:hypothetical protein [Acidimicrobiales bacterium]